MAALCFGTAALSAVPAGSGSLLLQNVGIGGAAVTMNVESFQEKKYKATLAQQYDFSCGSAALATLLTYNYNIPVGEQEVFQSMFENGDKQVIAESGFSLLDIKNYLTRRGLESNGYRAPLEKLAGVQPPAIVLVNVRGYAHFVVLEGIRDGWVLLSDPANGMRSEPVGEFENQWTGIFFLILTNADQGQERFNDNTRWAAAPSPPWELLRYTLDLGTLARPAMLGLAGCAVIVVGVLAGCSDSRITGATDNVAAFPKTDDRAAMRSAHAEAKQRFAGVALDDRQLGGIRGGLSTGSGIVVNFSFQEATYVNHNLTQSIIVPTMTIIPGATSASSAAMATGGSTVAGTGSPAAQAQVSTPSQIVQSVVNCGHMTIRRFKSKIFDGAKRSRELLLAGYHLILSAYGFWLPNDPRGSWSEVVRNPNLRVFGEATKVDTHRSVARRPHDRARRLAAKKALLYPPVTFTGVQARAIGTTERGHLAPPQ